MAIINNTLENTAYIVPYYQMLKPNRSLRQLKNYFLKSLAILLCNNIALYKVQINIMSAAVHKIDIRNRAIAMLPHSKFHKKVLNIIADRMNPNKQDLSYAKVGCDACVHHNVSAQDLSLKIKKNSAFMQRIVAKTSRACQKNTNNKQKHNTCSEPEKKQQSLKSSQKFCKVQSKNKLSFVGKVVQINCQQKHQKMQFNFIDQNKNLKIISKIIQQTLDSSILSKSNQYVYLNQSNKQILKLKKQIQQKDKMINHLKQEINKITHKIKFDSFHNKIPSIKQTFSQKIIPIKESKFNFSQQEIKSSQETHVNFQKDSCYTHSLEDLLFQPQQCKISFDDNILLRMIKTQAITLQNYIKSDYNRHKKSSKMIRIS